MPVLDKYTQVAYSRFLVEFIEALLFTQLLPEYLNDDGYRDVQLYLVHDPVKSSGGNTGAVEIEALTAP